MVARRLSILAAIAASVALVGSADARPRKRRRPPPEATRPRALAVAAAVVPGVAARGLGTYVAGDREGARALLATGGVGLGALVVGGLPLALTYGSGKLVVPGVPLAVVGTGLFLGSWWSDIYAAAGGAHLGGGSRSLPTLELGARAVWLREAHAGDRALGGVELRGWRGRWAGAVSGHGAHDGGLFLGRVDGAARVRGARGATATAIDLRAAIAGEWRRDERFRVGTSEVAARGRLAFADLAPGLAGSFVDLEAGLGLELVDYRAGDADLTGLVLARFAWGVFLPGRRGELTVFYDHRRDHLAGGLVAGRAAGFFGSVGATGEVVVGGYTATASVELGSALVTTVGLRRRLP